MTSRLGELLDRRQVLRLLISRDLKVKYARSALGYFWTVLEPLLLAVMYWFVFQKIANIDIDNYALFVISGILPWLWFSGTISSSTNALASQAKLVTSTNLPREIWVLRHVGARTAEFVFSLPVLLLFVVVMGVTPTSQIALYPVSFVIQVAFLTGISLFLSAVTVILPDLKRLIRVTMRIFFYLSPVLYPTGKVPESWQWVYILNPLVGILEGYRAAWFPQFYQGWQVLGVSALWAVGALALGWATFFRLERVVLKEL